MVADTYKTYKTGEDSGFGGAPVELCCEEAEGAEKCGL
jgi:hypothetical protein